jgi:tRNA(Arg) A34 adenosine deaminase TadA
VFEFPRRRATVKLEAPAVPSDAFINCSASVGAAELFAASLYNEIGEHLVNQPDQLQTSLKFDLPAWIGSVCRLGTPYRTPHEKMRLAITLSRENVEHGTGGPFGAAIFRADDHRLVAAGVNCVEPLRNSVLHAEMTAIMLAEQTINSHTLNLPGMPAHELYTSCSPCAMCLGAILWAGIRRLVWGARREDAMQIGFDEGPVFPQSHDYLRSRGIELVDGLLHEEANGVLRLYQNRSGVIYNG